MNTIVYANGRIIRWSLIDRGDRTPRFNVQLGDVQPIFDDYVQLTFDPENCSSKEFGILCGLAETIEQ